MSYKIEVLQGPDIKPFLADVARLRIAVFKEYPYLYDGDERYEMKYLERYTKSKNSVLVIARDGKKVIGASTGNYMSDEMPEVKQPLIEANKDLSEFFYFAESVLMPEYRGFGIGKEFMQKREEFARQIAKVKFLTFCSVDRSMTHKPPSSYKSPEVLWQKSGFVKQPKLICYISWKDIGDEEETKKPLTFWIKEL